MDIKNIVTGKYRADIFSDEKRCVHYCCDVLCNDRNIRIYKNQNIQSILTYDDELMIGKYTIKNNNITYHRPNLKIILFEA